VTEQAVSEAVPSEPAPAEPTAPATETAPAFPTEPGVVPGAPESAPRRRDDDDDDDDDDRFAPPQIGEAATPFINPIVGGPESFAVAGASLLASDGGAGDDGDGERVGRVEITPAYVRTGGTFDTDGPLLTWAVGPHVTGHKDKMEHRARATILPDAVHIIRDQQKIPTRRGVTGYDWRETGRWEIDHTGVREVEA